MTTVAPQPLPVLKGDRFTERLRAISSNPMPHDPLPDLRYQRMLIPGMVGGELMWATMGLLGVALRIRGADVITMSCDSMLPGCTLRKVSHTELACTRWCHRNAAPFAQALGMRHEWYSQYITSEERSLCRQAAATFPVDQLETVTWEGIRLGQEIVESIGSYYKVGRYNPDDPDHAAAAPRFVEAALMMYYISRRVLRKFSIDKVLVESGRYINWGVMRSVASAMGIPVDIIEVGAFGNSLKTAQDRDGQMGLSMPQWSQWKNVPLSDAEIRRLDELMARRDIRPYETRGADWDNRVLDPAALRNMLNLPEDRTGLIFAMFPNVGFDAVRTKTNPAFEFINDWIAETIEFFRARPEHHLVLKIHPSELHRDALDPTMVRLNDLIANPPANIHLLPPDTRATAQGLVRACDVALIYTSTVTAEAAYLNKPIILAGGGWHSRRGVTHDVSSPREYFDLLAQACDRTIELRGPGELGRRYAYALFFRTDIPIRYFQFAGVEVLELSLNDLSELAPGADLCVDAICNGILFDEPIVNPHH